MNHYPFDIQECNGTLEPKTNSDFFVKLVPKYLNYLGPTDLMKYQLEKNVSFIQIDNVKFQYIQNFHNYVALIQNFIIHFSYKLCILHSYSFQYIQNFHSHICSTNLKLKHPFLLQIVHFAFIIIF